MTERGAEKRERASNESMSAVIDPRAEQALDRIKAALSRRKGDEAVRFYEDACAHGLIPVDESALAWLHRTLGKDWTDKLISAYAGLPCFYCNKGAIRCEECKGRGYDEDRTLCAKCLALGIDRCDFCGGSGRFTINHVPQAFQLPMMIRRIVAARKEADALLDVDVPAISDSEPGRTRKQAAKNLLQVNRLMGVLENMAVAARQLESRHASERDTIRKALAACEAVAPKLRKRTFQLLGVLARASKLELGTATRTESRRLADRRAEFYGRLAASKNLDSAFLRRPFLFSDETAAAVPAEQPESPEPPSTPTAA